MPDRHRISWQAVAVAGAAMLGLAGCAAQEVERTPPTVTYQYQEGSFDVAESKAEEYCEMEYDADARLVENDEDGATNEATFECTDAEFDY